MFEHLAVTVTWIDFLDPALVGQPDVRERGVRVEVRPVRSAAGGSVYASPATALDPAVCRIDLLESAPGAADRMHWHPTMHDGEPGERTFEEAMPADPVGWLTRCLDGLDEFLARAGVPGAEAMARDLPAVRAATGEIGAAVADGLAWAGAGAWPDVEHDQRGLAAVR